MCVDNMLLASHLTKLGTRFTVLIEVHTWIFSGQRAWLTEMYGKVRCAELGEIRRDLKVALNEGQDVTLRQLFEAENIRK